MKKIPFHSLVEKIETGSITQIEIDRYFVCERDRSRPLNFLIGINTARVDTKNVPNAGALAKGLWQDASAVVERKTTPATKPPEFKRRVPIIAEGDSWFKIPKIYTTPMIDILKDKYGYPIINLATPGDTLGEIILDGQFWPYLGDGKADTLLFSAGGNDILGNGTLWQYLNIFDVDHQMPSDAPYYIQNGFYDNLNRVCDNYQGLIEAVKMRAPGTMIVGHGYDYALPTKDGPWLGEAMLRQGLHPVFRKKLCRAIIRVMIDAFNDRLALFQKTYPQNFTYVNLRGALTSEGEWRDELHATTAGAKKLAVEMNKALRRLGAPSSIQPPIPVRLRRGLLVA